MKCPSCHKSTLRKANFCHTCGAKLNRATAFELASPAIDPALSLPKSSVSKTDVIITTGLIWSLSLGGCWLAEIDPAWSVVPGLVTLIGPTIAEAAYHWVTLPKPPREQAQKIQVEHVDEIGRPRSLYDFEETITLDNLVWVATRIEMGQSFSRRGMCQPGKFSQGDFYKVRDEFLRLRYAFYKNPAVPNEGIILTPRCLKLLKKVVVDGG